MTNKNVFPCRRSLLRAAVAAVLGTGVSAGYAPQVWAAAADDDDERLEEVVVTGSRIVRRDLETNSPLLTIELQQFEDSAFISVEEALNDLPQFMVGGAGMNAGAVTSLQGANGMDGGRGTGDMFNMSLLPDNAGMIGIVVPGAANVNLRGLGANRALTLIDGHRAMPTNASMTVDLNTIPSIAIGGMEVITGGASAVYGADALAGVTNIKFRDNFEGMSVRERGGLNEVGDGQEYQVSTLFGSDVAGGRAHVLIGIEYSKREVALWNERDFFKEVMDSPYSNSGDFSFAWEPYYSHSNSLTTGNVPNRLQTSGAPAGHFTWNGNAPALATILSVFGDRTCRDATGAQLNCIVNATNSANGGSFGFNHDGTLFTRSSQATVNGVVNYYGPQSYTGGANDTATPGSPNEVTCTYVVPTAGVQGVAAGSSGFGGMPCNPTLNRVDYERWLASPRDANTFFGRGTFEINDNLSAFSNFHFATSNTETRREPAPFLGGFGAVIPFHSTQGGDAVYLPSVILTPAAGQVAGQTRPEFLAGGARGTSCAPMGGCLMSQAFPVPTELRTLLESRPATAVIPSTGINANNPFRGLSDCNLYKLADNLPAGTPGVLTNPASGARYIVETDPYTGQPYAKCGPNAGWQVNQQLPYLPPRGTFNTGQLFQIAFGLRGDLGLSDWTWELYGSTGASETQTQYVGFTSLNTYQRILSAPNYGQGYQETGTSSKYLTCTSGLSPFKLPGLQVSQDCIDALTTNQIDRHSMTQRVFELTAQGHVMNLPAGEVRGAMGAQHRLNSYVFQPDSTRERDYVTDTSAGQFASGSIDRRVDVNEVYGELLIPLLSDKPFINSLELELGARYSDYSTGQEVDTYKVMGSWEPLDWLRVRGGYNRAERAPNMSELFATPSASAQFAQIPNDPCRNFATAANNTAFFPGPTTGSSLNNSPTTDAATRAKLQALCSAHINQWGGNNSSTFHGDPNNWDIGGGGALVVGNENLRNEQGDTWTLGAALRSPFDHRLLQTITATVDWYKARVTDPIEAVPTGTIVNSCYNINGVNPNFALDDPLGFCSLIERDPGDGNIVRVYNTFDNLGKLEISGVDVNMRWNADLADLGLESLPGSLSVQTNMNFLIDQIQRYGAAAIDDYAGFGGAAEFRANTSFTYALDRHRLTLAWNYRTETDTNTNFAVTPNAEGSTSPTIQRNLLMAGYEAVHLFNLTAGTTFGNLNASLSVNNLFDKKPRPGGYDVRDPLNGYGSFSPFDDLVGRRYLLNLTMDF